MSNPADTIREALTNEGRTFRRDVVLAALTELEQERDQLLDNANLLREERDRLEADRDRLADTLREIANLDTRDDEAAVDLARAALDRHTKDVR